MLTQTYAKSFFNAMLTSTQNWSLGTKVYLALFSGDPGYNPSSTTTGNLEPSADDGYARADATGCFTTGDASWNDADDCYEISNSSAIMFPECHNESTGQAEWGTLTYFGLCTDSTRGSVPYFVGKLSGDDGIYVDEGKVALFRKGELTLKLTGLDADTE